MVPSGRTSLTALLPVSATKTSPAASTATPVGSLNPEPMGRMVPLGRTSLTALLPGSATKTSPAASTATPVGLVEPGADGRDGAVGQDLLDGVVAVSATKTSPAASTATPDGLLEPGADGGRRRWRVNEGSVEYWNRAVVVEPFGLTVALSVAPVAEIETAAPVVTDGGVRARVVNDCGGL